MIRRAAVVLALAFGSACSNAAPEIMEPVFVGVLPLPTRAASLLIARTQPIAVARTHARTLHVLSLPDGKERRMIDYGDRGVIAADLSPDGSKVAIGDWTGLITVWDTATGQVRFERRLSKYPGFLAFSPDGRKLATAAQGDAVQILDAASGAPVATLGSPAGGTLALAFSRDGRSIATGDGDTIVRIHDATTGKEVAANREFLMVPLAVAFSADSASVFAAGGDKFVTVIDAASGKASRRFDRTTQPTQALDVSPDGKFVGTAFMKSEDMTQPDHLVLRALNTWQPQVDWLPPAMPIGAGWTSDGHWLIALASDEGVHLWRLR